MLPPLLQQEIVCYSGRFLTCNLNGKGAFNTGLLWLMLVDASKPPRTFPFLRRDLEKLLPSKIAGVAEILSNLVCFFLLCSTINPRTVHTQTQFSISSDRGAGPSAGEGGEQPLSQRAGNHCAILGNAACPLCFGSHPQLGLRRREIKSTGMPVKHEAGPPTSVEAAGHGLCGSLGCRSLLFRRRSPRGWLPEAVPAVLWSREETGQKRVDVEQLSSPI